MDDLKLKVNDLSYDLLGLQNIIYGLCVPGATCTGGSCDGGCTESCAPINSKKRKFV
ncbi:MAG: hypothetical protein KAW12_12670 [Candidatus Aminicenantes bacterium]|nr:hypothetical protein [Candidatus Aminicenantes bacterium]